MLGRILYYLKIFNIRNLRLCLDHVRLYGFKSFFIAVKRALKYKYITSIADKYEYWMKNNEPDHMDLDRQKHTIFRFSPKITVIFWGAQKELFSKTVQSVSDQTYPLWELVCSDGQRHGLERFSNDRRIKFRDQKDNSMKGDFFVFLKSGDELAPFALFEVVRRLNGEPEADFIYSDEDRISEDGRRSDPLFKPDWSPDTLRSYNYIGDLIVLRRDLFEKAGILTDNFEELENYDLVLRAAEKAQKIVHIPKVLYHRRLDKDRNNLALHESGKRVLQAHIERLGLKGSVADGLFQGSYKITYRIEGEPKVSIIIPNKDNIDDLEKCIVSVLGKTAYKNYEIIIVENNSREKRTFDFYKEAAGLDKIKIITWDKPFNYSAINNFAVKHSTGSVLLFLNNDTEVINSDWLERMLEHAQRNEVGAVGAKLYYKDDTVQHAGIILGFGPWLSMHSHYQEKKESPGYMGRLQVVQNMSAVTGACLMVRKDVFNEVGGFEEGFHITYNDIDLCLKIRQKGYLVIWTPYAELYHYESKTRGVNNTKEKKNIAYLEAERFGRKWMRVFEEGDPYYNPNLSTKKDFSIRIERSSDFNLLTSLELYKL